MPSLQHSPPDPTPLSQALKNAVQAASTRAEEGQRIFSPIADLWDTYQQSEAVRRLPQHLRKPVLALCQEISKTAAVHFDSYIKGTRPTQARPAQQPITPPTPLTGTTTPDTTASPAPALPTYAQKAATPPPPPQLPTVTALKTQVTKAPTARPDTRLFVRVSPDHISRKAGPFALLTALKPLLGQDSTLLQEVQEVKSGFALCTGSLEALTKLESYSEAISSSFGDAVVERQPQWTSYRLLNVPRTVNTINGAMGITSNQVTGQILAETVREATNQPVTRAVETKDSIQKNFYNSSWIVSFPTEGHTPLTRSLRILGATITAAVIKTKPKTTQCTRCFYWHNARSCTRPQTCRLCGSKQHQEETHSTNCATSAPHTCPARCLHCGGPHPADYPQCLLRPTPRGPKTKSEKTAILETSKLARLRACTAANCSRNPRTDPGAQSTPSPGNPLANPRAQNSPANNQFSLLQMEVLPTTPCTPTRKSLPASALTPTRPRLSAIVVDSSIPISFNA
jgi:hypothetical protein